MSQLTDDDSNLWNRRGPGGVAASTTHSILIVDQAKCDGCGECVAACEAARRSTSPGSGACIAVIALQDEGPWFPLVCQQCEDAPCALTCPTGALSRDPDTPSVSLDQKRCVGCGMCLVSCPFGAIRLDAKAKKMAKCDLCGGDPACAKKCKAGALKFASPHTLGKERRMAIGA
ncbi:MAG: 4Fe-4S dicluster domain-containing protein, partial [Dehalococcoidia bacterium]|nr:4Fe-4S dicluster domain-containing protein [Dehalococcoidia bacterium]